MKKLILVLLTVTDLAFAAPKPIIKCSAEGQVNNDIMIELSAIDKDGNVTDILRDVAGNEILLGQSKDRRLTWVAKLEIRDSEFNLYVSLEDGETKMTKVKSGEQIGATAKIKCENVGEALVYDRTKRVGL